MKHTLHTLAPWTVNGPYLIEAPRTMADPSGAVVVAQVIKGRTIANEQRDANAKLIASAPDLLAALQSVSYWADRVNSLQHAGNPILESTWGELFQATNEAQAAIAKATH